MADAKISALPSATVPLAGTEVLPIVQGGTTDKVTAADLLRQNGQTVTTSNPVLSLAQTWNAGGVTFTGLKFNATDTASAAASLILDLQVGGVSQFSVTKAGRLDMLGLIAAGGNIVGAANVQAGASSSLLWSGSTVLKAASDGFVRISNNAQSITADIGAEAANTLALRNGTNAQTFRVYNTYTDASNYERGVFDWSTAANALTIGTQKAGTGATRVINFHVGNAQRVQFGAASATLDVGLIFGADNTYDIGASGANRPRTGYFGTSVLIGGVAPAGASGLATIQSFGSAWAMIGGSNVTDATAKDTYFGSLHYTNTEEPVAGLRIGSASGENYVYIGGARSNANAATTVYIQTAATTTTLEGNTRWYWNSSGHYRAAADNTYDIGASGATRPRTGYFGTSVITPLLTSTGLVHAYSGTAIPAGGTAGAGLRVSSTADFGVFFGSGAPTLSAAKGSLYLRSDGTTTNDRMYVNTDGSTTWTAVTTAA